MSHRRLEALLAHLRRNPADRQARTPLETKPDVLRDRPLTTVRVRKLRQLEGV